MSLCGAGAVYSLGHPVCIAVSLPCRSWGCFKCGPKRAKQLRRLAHAGKPTKFVTLTVKPSNFEEPADAARALSNAFKKLVKRWRRFAEGKEIEYLAVFEPTKQGWPHLHVIMRAPYTAQSWLSRQMNELLGSPIVDIRAVSEPKRVAWYIAKYITKSNTRFSTLKRYWASKGWNLELDEVDALDVIDKHHWWMAGAGLKELEIEWRRAGMTVAYEEDDRLYGFYGTPPPLRDLRHLTEKAAFLRWLDPISD